MVWRLVAAGVTPTSYYTDNTTAGNLIPRVDPRVNSVLIAASFGSVGSSGLSASYSGTDTVTERADAATGGTKNARYGAYDSTLAETDDNEHLTITTSSTNPSTMIAAVWR